MASMNNVPRDILESMRDSLDRRIKLSIKRMVNYETRKEKWENRVLAFSMYRLFVFTARSPTRVESSFHYLDIESIESKKPNHLVITTATKTYTFTALEAETEEINHMIIHIGTSLKSVFPAVNLDKLIKKVEVQPSDRIQVMYNMMKTIEQKETGPCGNFTSMYASMCDLHGLVYRDEVAWDVDTIYLSQDSRELCLRDFDHLKERDLVPIVSALIHNNWFTSLNANNVRLTQDVCNEILRLMKKNEVIESLLLSGTGIGTDFIKKLALMSMSGTALHTLDLSNTLIDDIGAEHLFGSLSSRGKMFTMIDLSKTKVTSKGLNKIAEAMNKSPHVFSSLQTLKLAHLTSNRVDDMQNMYSFFAAPNMLSHLDISGTDFELERLMSPLQRGCSQSITVLKLSKLSFTSRKSRDVTIPPSFKQFFSSVYSLKHLDLSNARLPPEAIKDLFLGINSNRNVTDLHIDISGIDLIAPATQYLQNCLSNMINVASLNISNIGFQDQELIGVLQSIGENKSIKQLVLGRVFQNVKPKNLAGVMDELVRVIQEDDGVLESLSLADSRLKDSMNTIINALGSNSSLTEIDISGNLMGDLGARMLSKALQINNKLKTIVWDKNCTGCQGFEDIADALDKNYTLKKMPIPVYDASAALRAHPERTEQALQKIERLLQRNHSPQKYSSDQAYRLQQGFLISSTQQMVDRLVVQSQDTINALSIDSLEPYSTDVETAKLLIKDADRSKMLLPRLHDIANQSQNTGSPIEEKLKEISIELKSVLEEQIQTTVNSMLESTAKQCKTIMKDKALMSELQTGCREKSSFPKDFTKNILDGVDTDIFNKLSELNLAVAAHISDRIIDEVIERLSKSHKTLTDHLNQKKKDVTRRGQSKKMEENETNMRTKDTTSSPNESPKIQSKRKSMHARKIRPQSVIEMDMFRRLSEWFLGFLRKPDSENGLDDTEKLPPEKPNHASETPSNELIESFDDVPELSFAPKLSHATKDRPKRTKNIRPNTRQSALPASTEVKVDEDMESFFSKPTSSGPPVTTPGKTEESPKSSSNKSTPEARKKSGGLFGFGNKDSKEKDKDKEQRKTGMLSGFLKKATGKPSPPPASSKSGHRISNVQEEDEKSSLSSSMRRSVTENSSLRGSFDGKQSDKSVSSSSTKGSVKSERYSTKGDVTPDQMSVHSIDRETTSSEEKESENTGSSLKESKESVVEKKPLMLPKTKRSFSKADDVKKSEEERKEVVDTSSEVKKESEMKVSQEADELAKHSEKRNSSVKTGATNDNENTPGAESSETKPEPPAPVVPRRPMAPGGLGFGVNLMAEMKEKQKRKSMMPGSIPSPKPPEKTADQSPKQEKKEPLFVLKNLRHSADQNRKQSEDQNSGHSEDKQSGHSPKHPPEKTTDLSPKEEKKEPLFGLKNLRHSGDKNSGHSEDKNVRHSEDQDSKVMSSKQSEADVKAIGKTMPDKVSDVDTTSSDNSNRSSSKSDSKRSSTTSDTEDRKSTSSDNGEKIEEKSADKPSVFGNKPVVTARQGILKPPITKPKPPANKPKPAPRTSLSQSDDQDSTVTDSVSKEKDTKQDGGIVYDSATLKMSVKDKIAKKNAESGVDIPVKKEDKRQKLTMTESSSQEMKTSVQEAKKDAFTNASAKSDVKKGNSLPRETTPDEIDKGVFLSQDDLQACELDLKFNPSSDMTDSGIVYDTELTKMSVKDKKTNVFGDTVQKKSGSLPRDIQPLDMKEEPSAASKRPRSMFSVLENRPDLKNKLESEKKSDIEEEEEKQTDSENTDTKTEDKNDTADQHSPADVVMV